MQKLNIVVAALHYLLYQMCNHTGSLSWQEGEGCGKGRN